MTSLSPVGHTLSVKLQPARGVVTTWALPTESMCTVVILSGQPSWGCHITFPLTRHSITRAPLRQRLPSLSQAMVIIHRLRQDHHIKQRSSPDVQQLPYKENLTFVKHLSEAAGRARSTKWHVENYYGQAPNPPHDKLEPPHRQGFRRSKSFLTINP